MKIAAISDTHEDSQATCCGKIVLGPDGVNIRAADRRRCFAAAVDGAIARKVDLILHAGDVFEGEHGRNRPKPTPTEYVLVERELDRAADWSPTVLIGDNHGMGAGIEEHAIAPLAGRHKNLHVCVRPDLLVLSTTDGPVQVAVLPFPKKAILLAKEEYQTLSPEAVNQLIGEKLASIVRGLRARLDPLVPSICLTHILTREAVFGNDRSPDPGMLTMSVEDFAGFDLVVAGDVHGHQIIGDRFLIPGSTDRTDFGEEHNTPGWCYVEIDGPGAIPRVEYVATPARRYLTYRDINEAKAESFEVADLSTDPVVRIKARLTQEEYDALGPELARWRAYPLFQDEIEVIRQTRARSEEMTADLSPENSLVLWHQVHERPEDLGALLEVHRALEVGSDGRP